MTWSIEEIISLITMLITIPSFVLALCAFTRFYRRTRNMWLGSPLHLPTAGYLPLTPSENSVNLSGQPSPKGDSDDLERGWIQFNHVITSTISRGGSFRIDIDHARDGMGDGFQYS
ncbi:uncharacterized protein BDV17DRAFT_86977 [Aspergillus undulatus]|uniref:uncharacterized protein n=1 Tax=Aspergillus undulatus TaxID=1810928 RepID=UPI003CCD0487